MSRAAQNPSPRLVTLARICGLTPSRVASELRKQGIRDARKHRMRTLAAVLAGEDLARARSEIHAERMRGQGSKYWVAGYPRLLAEWHPKRNSDVFNHEWCATP